MREYVGRYRVTCEFDWNHLKPMSDEPYIVCRGGGQIFRYKGNILKYHIGKHKDKTLISKLKGRGVQLVEEAIFGEFDTEIAFYERDLDIVAEIIGALTKGANIKPNSKRNLKLFEWYRKGEHLPYYTGK